LQYIKNFGDQSFDSEEPLESPDHSDEKLQAEDAENGPAFTGYYHQRSLRKSRTIIEDKHLATKQQLPALRKSKSMGGLMTYTPEQLASMNTGELAAALQKADLLRQCKGSS